MAITFYLFPTREWRVRLRSIAKIVSSVGVLVFDNEFCQVTRLSVIYKKMRQAIS